MKVLFLFLFCFFWKMLWKNGCATPKKSFLKSFVKTLRRVWLHFKSVTPQQFCRNGFASFVKIVKKKKQNDIQCISLVKQKGVQDHNLDKPLLFTNILTTMNLCFEVRLKNKKSSSSSLTTFQIFWQISTSKLRFIFSSVLLLLQYSQWYSLQVIWKKQVQDPLYSPFSFFLKDILHDSEQQINLVPMVSYFE